jgi:hypothetical protein
MDYLHIILYPFDCVLKSINESSSNQGTLQCHQISSNKFPSDVYYQIFDGKGFQAQFHVCLEKYIIEPDGSANEYIIEQGFVYPEQMNPILRQLARNGYTDIQAAISNCATELRNINRKRKNPEQI